MIRPYRPDDMEPILAIWLQASIIAHDFIDASFWQSKLGDMREIYLPSALTWVYERDGQVQGFVSLLGDVLAAIFVSPDHQGNGVGSALIEPCKRCASATPTHRIRRQSFEHRVLSPSRFEVSAQGIDEHTGHPQLTMAWREGELLQVDSIGPASS